MQYVHINLAPLKKFKDTIEQDLRGSGSGPVRKALQHWGLRFRQFIQERFDKFSRGGGGWPDLKPSTKRARRQGNGGGSFTILRDTNTLFSALDPAFSRKPGQLQEDIPFGVKVGYGGSARHPKAGMTIVRLAQIHNDGLGTVPARPIIVPPDARTVKLMVQDMAKAIGEII